MEIRYDQGSEFSGHEFRKYQIKIEYRITAKLNTSGNPTSNAILEQINHIIGNLVQNFNITETYVYEDDPWSLIMAATSFGILSTINSLNCLSLEKLVFGNNMVLLIKHKVNWELICQQNQAQINRHNILKNIRRFDHYNKVGDKFMPNNSAA